LCAVLRDVWKCVRPRSGMLAVGENPLPRSGHRGVSGAPRPNGARVKGTPHGARNATGDYRGVQPVFLPPPRVSRKRRRLLRPGQLVSESRARPATGDSHLVVGGLSAHRPPAGPAAAGNQYARTFPAEMAL